MSEVPADESTQRRPAALISAVALALTVGVFGGALGLHATRPGGPGAGSAGAPVAREGAAMAFDGTGVILTGGRSGDRLLDDTWRWDGSAWALLHPAHSPPARAGALAAWDEASKRVVLVGGEAGGEPGGTASSSAAAPSGVSAPESPAGVAPRSPNVGADRALRCKPRQENASPIPGTALGTPPPPPPEPPAGGPPLVTGGPTEGPSVLAPCAKSRSADPGVWIWENGDWCPGNPLYPTTGSVAGVTYSAETGEIVVRTVSLSRPVALPAVAGCTSAAPASPTTPGAKPPPATPPPPPIPAATGGTDPRLGAPGASGRSTGPPVDQTTKPGGVKQCGGASAPCAGPPPPSTGAVDGCRPAGSNSWLFFGDGDRWRGADTHEPGAGLTGFSHDPASKQLVAFTTPAAGCDGAKPDPSESSRAAARPSLSPLPPTSATAGLPTPDVIGPCRGARGLGPACCTAAAYTYAAGRWTQSAQVHMPSLAGLTPEGTRTPAGSTGRGLLGLGAMGETFEWGGTDWVDRHPPAAPPPRTNFSLAADDRGHVLLFGGRSSEAGAPVDLADLWSWDGHTWTRLSAVPSATPAATASGPTPPARADATLSFDGTGVILFGGDDGDATLGDMWRWEEGRWIELKPAHLPGPREGATAVFDEATRRVVLLGGRAAGPSEAVSATQPDELRCTASPAVAPVATPFPSDQSRISSRRTNCRRVSLVQDNVWVWDGTDWSRGRPLGGAPSIIRGAAYSPEQHSVVVESVAPGIVHRPECLVAQSLSPTAPLTGCPDSTRPSRLLVGDGTRWEGMDGPPGTANIGLAGLAFDRKTQRLIAFGGPAPGQALDHCCGSWAYAYAQGRWTEVTDRSNSTTSLTIASEGERGLLGVEAGIDGVGDTSRWAEPPTWERLHPSISPGRRRGLALAEDGHGGVLLFGGNAQCVACPSGSPKSTLHGDLWKWTGERWVRLGPDALSGPSQTPTAGAASASAQPASSPTADARMPDRATLGAPQPS